MRTKSLESNQLHAAIGLFSLLMIGCAGQGMPFGSSDVGTSSLVTVTVEATDANFQTLVLENPDLVMVDFWAPWCGPCKKLGPVVEELAEEYAGRVVVAKMDIDQNPMTPEQYGIDGIPALLIFKDGKMVDSLVGVQPKAKIAKTMDSFLGPR